MRWLQYDILKSNFDRIPLREFNRFDFKICPSHRLVAVLELKSTVCPYYLLIDRGRIFEFILVFQFHSNQSGSGCRGRSILQLSPFICSAFMKLKGKQLVRCLQVRKCRQVGRSCSFHSFLTSASHLFHITMTSLGLYHHHQTTKRPTIPFMFWLLINKYLFFLS